MTEDAEPRDALRAAVGSLSEERARALLSWLRAARGGREAPAEPVEAPADAAEAPERSTGPLGDLLGIVVEAVEPGRARLSVTVDPSWHNPNGVLHGGVIYVLVDSGMGIALSATLGEGESCASIGVTVNYLAPVREGTLTAETQIVRQGRNIAFTESKVTDDQGWLVATASGSLFIFRGSQE